MILLFKKIFKVFIQIKVLIDYFLKFIYNNYIFNEIFNFKYFKFNFLPIIC